MFIFSIILTIVATVIYHVSQKSIPTNVNPIASLIVSYIVAIIGSIILYPFFDSKIGIIASFQEVNSSSFILGIGLIALELGYLLVYRSGWNINFAAIFVNAIATLMLIPIGMLFFKTKVSLINIVGAVVCIIGLVLIKK